MSDYALHCGDALTVLRTLPSGSVQMCCSSPPYFGLRSYLPDDHPDKQFELGAEETPEAYVERMTDVFREVRRVLRDDGTLWLNIGDSYATSPAGNKTWGNGVGSNRHYQEGQIHQVTNKQFGVKQKDLLGIPWMLAFALRADGWWLRQEIIWAKTAPMPESVTDRCTKAHEQVFLLAKSREYFFDNESIKEPLSPESMPRMLRGVGNGHKTVNGAPGQTPHSINRPRDHGEGYDAIDPSGRNKRSVWTLGPEPYSGSHYAVMPTKLVEPCVLAGTSAKGCCSACGSPYERVTNDHKEVTGHGGRSHSGNRDSSRNDVGIGTMYKTIRETVDWQPTCTCFGHFELVDAPRDYDEDGNETVASQLRPARRVFVADGDMPEPVPCTVLDPFAGSGTTLAVALKFGRRAIGIDLDERNMKLVHERIAKMQPMLFSEVTA